MDGVAGIDVHKKMLAVVVRRETAGKPEYEQRKFGATHKEILALAAWAVAHRIAKVIWLMLHEGVDYKEPGPAPAKPRTLTRKLRRLLQEFSHSGIDAKPLLEEPVLGAS
jgi:hypothetical protein